MNSNNLQQTEMSQLQSNWSLSPSERLISKTGMKMKSANATTGTLSNESSVITTPVVQSEQTFPSLEANYTWPVPRGTVVTSKELTTPEHQTALPFSPSDAIVQPSETSYEASIHPAAACGSWSTEFICQVDRTVNKDLMSAAQASITLKQTEEYKKGNGTVEVNQEMAAIVDSSPIAEECNTEIVNEQSTPTAPVIESQLEFCDAKMIESATHLPKSASSDRETLKDSNVIQPILTAVPETILPEHDCFESPKDDGKNSAIEHLIVPPVGSAITFPMNDTITVHNAVLLSGTKSLIDSEKKTKERPNEITVHSNELVNFPVEILESRTLPNDVAHIKARPAILNAGAKVVLVQSSSQPISKRPITPMNIGKSQRPIPNTGGSTSANVTTLKRKIHENIPPIIPSKVQRVEKRVNGSSVASMKREGNSRPIPTVEYSNSTSTAATTLKRNVQQNNPPIISSKGQRMAKPFPSEGNSKPSVRRVENLNSTAVNSTLKRKILDHAEPIIPSKVRKGPVHVTTTEVARSTTFLDLPEISIERVGIGGVKKTTSTVDLTSYTGQQSKDRSFLDCLKLLKRNNVAISKVPKESSDKTLDKYKNFFDRNNISVARIRKHN